MCNSFLVHLLGGTIVVGNLFGFPGLGQALVSAVGTGDTVAVQAIAALFVAIFLLTDLLATLFNPRLRGVPPGESTRWILRRKSSRTSPRR
ncbi:MAG: ABC transporter permease subunit [Pseudonocardiaceae bacterium]